jgi:hypothetical protein
MARVTPGRMPASSGGVTTVPRTTAKMFDVVPSVTSPAGVT